jgi:hypothetical protein
MVVSCRSRQPGAIERSANYLSFRLVGEITFGSAFGIQTFDHGSDGDALASIELIATLACAIFAGAAIYINFVEHPVRMLLRLLGRRLVAPQLERRERTNRDVVSVRIPERELLCSSTRVHVRLLFEPDDESA